MEHTFRAPPIPKAFIWRRAHSFTGLWLVLFLIEHLLTNSQAALFFGENGSGFIHAVNGLKNLPYLPVIEIVLLAIPFLIHGWWGIVYLMTGKFNSFSSDGSTPALPQYSRNHAYTWQRITSWILLVGIIAHVIHMRFIQYPTFSSIGTEQYYMIPLNEDPGLFTLSKRLGFELYNQKQIEELKEKILSEASKEESGKITEEKLVVAQKRREQHVWIKEMEKWPLKKDQLLSVSPSFGIAELLMVRDTFKSPTMILLYAGLVLAACFHAFNGLWTFMISWGITLTARSQQMMRTLATSLMVLIAFLGLAAICGTYWFNLKQ